MLYVVETKLLRLVTAVCRRLPCWVGATGYGMCGVDFPCLGHGCYRRLPPLAGATGYAIALVTAACRRLPYWGQGWPSLLWCLPQSSQL